MYIHIMRLKHAWSRLLLHQVDGKILTIFHLINIPELWIRTFNNNIPRTREIVGLLVKGCGVLLLDPVVSQGRANINHWGVNIHGLKIMSVGG